MRIMHVCKKYPRAIGGDAVVVSQLVRRQRKAGHTVSVVTSNCAEIMPGARIYKCGLKDTPTGLDLLTWRRVISLLLLFFKMFYILRKEHPHIIHAHSIDMTFVISFAARFYGIPVIHTFHIVTFYDQNQAKIRRATEVWLAKKAQLRLVTAPNNYDVAMLHQAGLTQATLLANGVDLEYWQPDRPATPRWSVPIFVAVGRLEDQKGYSHLIEAAAMLQQRTRQKFKVIIVGGGSQQAKLQQLIRQTATDHCVRLVGTKSPAQIRFLLQQAYAVLLPSLYETTPLTLLEAWAAGAPVIASSVGILRDAPPDFAAATIIPAQDPAQLMQAMRHYLEHPSLRQQVALAGQKEVAQYDWPSVTQTVERLYRSAA